MHTTFYINISVRTADGPQPFGHFNLGENRESAYSLFKRLKGSPEVNYNDMLYIEFSELINGLPLNIDILTCDLQELGTNCMLITQEVFKISNLKV